MSHRVELDAVRLERYSRQILVSGFGGQGQHRLFQAHVVITGTSEIAETIALSLGRAGVGQLYVSEAVAERLDNRYGPDTRVIPYATVLPSLTSPAVLVDTSLEHRTAPDCSLASGVRAPVLWARARGTTGLVGVWNPSALRCTGWFFSFLPQNCPASPDELFARHWVAYLASALVLRHLSGRRDSMPSFLLGYDVVSGNVEALTPPETFHCDHCGDRH
ncbi:MAG: hypothetical protein KatS3mg077_1097 [Candidatus Binatia bacterium]|nr:MAG: hypothetical protein KatS3mg077_1097 [Candidatus Binatia bacterium]